MMTMLIIYFSAIVYYQRLASTVDITIMLPYTTAFVSKLTEIWTSLATALHASCRKTKTSNDSYAVSSGQQHRITIQWQRASHRCPLSRHQRTIYDIEYRI